MTDAPKVRELLDIPEHVEKSQFQVSLAEGVARPEQTVGDYVITPRLVDAFDRALSTIDHAMAEQRSVGSYLHGRFGSGKSHFMAMPSLLLANEPAAWRRAEFDPLRARFAWIVQREVVELHMHMLGKNSLAEAIYPANLEFLAAQHPSAPLPALFADEDLFWYGHAAGRGCERVVTFGHGPKWDVEPRALRGSERFEGARDAAAVARCAAAHALQGVPRIGELVSAARRRAGDHGRARSALTRSCSSSTS